MNNVACMLAKTYPGTTKIIEVKKLKTYWSRFLFVVLYIELPKTWINSSFKYILTFHRTHALAIS